MRKQLGILLGCGLAAGTLVAVNVIPADQAVAAGLVPFGTCPEVLDHLKDEARDRVGPWGLQTGGGWEWFASDGDEEAVADSAAGSDSAMAGAGSSRSHSTTNVQEAGVDEPDIVKTDGRLIVTTLGSTLQVIDAGGDAPVKVGELSLSEQYGEASLLLAGDRAMAFVRDYSMIATDAILPDHDWEHPVTRVVLVDLSDPANPAAEATLEVDGSYLDARLVDGTVRVVVSSAPRLQFPMDENDWKLSEDELTERNRAIVAESTIDDWLPSYRLQAAGQESEGRLVECEQLNHPPDFAGFSTISVLTLDFDALSAGDAVGVLTDGDTVYASADNLYVATAQWGEATGMSRSAAMDIAWWPRVDGTGIHAFDISGDGPARYLASGNVDGEIIGRYAMSEHEGVLRIATTTDAWDEDKSESQLVTLAEQGDKLVQVGAVGGLGKTERIYAVRYFGDTAYVVTFRQVDPLYVLDLSDPAEPSVEGELKITGYSSYLHPVAEDRLVGIGQEATEQGRTIGTQISLFDVSDPTAPTKLAGLVKENAWSDAESNPHAFLYWPQTRHLVVPIYIHGHNLMDEPMEEPTIEPEEPGGDGDEPVDDEGLAEDDFAYADEVSGAMVLTVDDGALTEQGIITQGRTDRPNSGYYWSSIVRTLVIGDSLYTLWYDGLQVNDLESLEFQSWLTLNSDW